MKQHITINQLNELSDKGKERLRAWWQPDTNDIVTYLDKDLIKWVGVYMNEVTLDKKGAYDRKLYLLPSIGQMIEFLRGNEIDVRDKASNYIDENGYDVALSYYISPNDKGFDLGWSGELCDALWEAVKEILEK